MKQRLVVFIFLIFGCQIVSSQTCLTILFTGHTNGALNDCACPPIPWGGIARRKTLIDSLRHNHRHTLLVDTGNFLSTYPREPWDEHVLRATELFDYDALLVEPSDMKYDPSFYMKSSLPLIIPISSTTHDAENWSDFQTFEVEGEKVIILGVESSPDDLDPSNLVTITERVSTIIETQGTKAFVLILSLLSHEENIDLLQQLPHEIHAILGNRDRDEVYGWSSEYEGALLAKSGIEGRTVGSLNIRSDTPGTWGATVTFHPVRHWIPEHEGVANSIRNQ